MSRTLISLTLVLALAVGVSVAGDYSKTTELAWFDMQNCSMCENMPMELYSSMTWEQHPISNGVVSVTTVTAEALPAYREAHGTMMVTGEKLMSGEQMALCGSCSAFSACMMKGASYEYVETMNGDLMIVTANDAEVVAELKSWAERNKEEMAKMMKSESRAALRTSREKAPGGDTGRFLSFGRHFTQVPEFRFRLDDKRAELLIAVFPEFDKAGIMFCRFLLSPEPLADLRAPKG